jgi:hypothetical protein
MKLNLYRLRRMIMEELDSRRGRGRLNEADGTTITVEQFLDEQLLRHNDQTHI